MHHKMFSSIQVFEWHFTEYSRVLLHNDKHISILGFFVVTEHSCYSCCVMYMVNLSSCFIIVALSMLVSGVLLILAEGSVTHLPTNLLLIKDDHTRH